MKDSDVPSQLTFPVDPSDPNRRRRRWRFLIGFGITGVVLSLALLLYAQSEHALIHIYLPMLSQRLGARIQAAGGAIHWNGRIHLSNLKLAGIDGEPALQVELINLKIRPSTLLGGALPTIDELLLLNPRLRLRVDDEGNTNMNYAHAANPQKISEAQRKAQRAASSPQTFPLVRLGRLEIRNLTLDYANVAGLRLTIDRLDLAAVNMVPGKTGNFNLTLAGREERLEEGAHEEGILKASGDLTQKPGGQALGWTASLDLAIQSRLPDFPTTQSITLKSKTEGSVTAGGQWNQTFQLEAATPQGPAGHAQGDLVWDDMRPLHRASLKIQGIGPQVLNPLLTPLGKTQIVDARLDADCRIIEDAKGIHFNSSVTANRVSFRRGKDPATLGPVALTLIQNGVFDPAKREVRWDEFDLTINPASRHAGDAADRIKIKGLCRVGKPMNLKLDLRVASLTADPYMDWLDRISSTGKRGDLEPTSKTKPRIKKPPSQDPGNDKKIQPTDGALIEANVTIDQARYRKAALERVIAKVREKNGVLDFRIERGKLCGGDVTLHVEANRTRRLPHYAWDASLNGSDVAALMSVGHEAPPTAAVETATAHTHEAPRGRISTLLHAITSRAKNVVVDITDMAGALKPRPRQLTGKVSLTSRGTGQGSGPDLLRALESETKFEIKDGVIQGFFVLDALAIATRIDTFRKFDFDHSSGVARTREGKAVFQEVGVSGALHKVELTGQYDLVDHSYDLKLQPAIGSQYLNKITNNPFLPHLIRDSQGYLTFPFEVAVQSDSAGRRKVMVFPKLPQGLNKIGGKVGETVRGAVGGAIEESRKIVKEPRHAIKKSMEGINESVGKGLRKLGKKWRGEKNGDQGK